VTAKPLLAQATFSSVMLIAEENARQVAGEAANQASRVTESIIRSVNEQPLVVLLISATSSPAPIGRRKTNAGDPHPNGDDGRRTSPLRLDVAQQRRRSSVVRVVPSCC
jgi:hypothetical protein